MNKNTITYTFYVLKYVYYLYLNHSKTSTPLVFSILGDRADSNHLPADPESVRFLQGPSFAYSPPMRTTFTRAGIEWRR